MKSKIKRREGGREGGGKGYYTNLAKFILSVNSFNKSSFGFLGTNSAELSNDRYRPIVELHNIRAHVLLIMTLQS